MPATAARLGADVPWVTPSTENKVAFSHQSYNDAVMVYNTQREVFPSSLISSRFNFSAAELFVVEAAEQREPPQVAFA